MSGPRVRPALVAAVAVSMLALPSGIRAQGMDVDEDARGAMAAPGPETEIGLGLGALMPLSNMGQTEAGATIGLSTSFSVGAGVTRWLDERWGIAADGLWATGGPDARTAADGGGGGDDGGAADGGGTYVTGTARLVHRFRSFAGVVEPRIGVGAGIRHVALDETDAFGSIDETGPAAVLTAGVRTAVNSRTALTVELRDVVTSTDIEGATGAALQNDLLVLVGVSFNP